MKEQNPETVELLEPSNAGIIAEHSKWTQYGRTKSNETGKQQKRSKKQLRKHVTKEQRRNSVEEMLDPGREGDKKRIYVIYDTVD